MLRPAWLSITSFILATTLASDGDRFGSEVASCPRLAAVSTRDLVGHDRCRGSLDRGIPFQVPVMLKSRYQNLVLAGCLALPGPRSRNQNRPGSSRIAATSGQNICELRVEARSLTSSYSVPAGAFVQLVAHLPSETAPNSSSRRRLTVSLEQKTLEFRQ